MNNKGEVVIPEDPEEDKEEISDDNGEIAEMVMEDDKQFHPVYNCAPVVPKEVPHLADILNPIARVLDDRTMASLNMEVDINNRSPDEVAREWL